MNFISRPHILWSYLQSIKPWKMSTLPPSTANWHWKNKNVTAWGKSWFERELVTVQIKGDGSEVVSITEVSDVDGDVELGQRKSKWVGRTEGNTWTYICSQFEQDSSPFTIAKLIWSGPGRHRMALKLTESWGSPRYLTKSPSMGFPTTSYVLYSL